MTISRSHRTGATRHRATRLLHLFRPAAPFVGVFADDRDAQRQLTDLRAARSHAQVPTCTSPRRA